MNENTQNNQSTKRLQFEIDPMTGRLSSQSASRYFSRFGWFVFTMALVVQVVITAVYTVTAIAFPNVYSHFAFGDVISFVTIYGIALPVSLPLLLKLPYEKPVSAKMSVGGFWIGFCICMALMTIGSNISSIFLNLVQNLSGSTTENPLEVAISSTPWWFNLLTTVILAPILEELLFRRLVCNRLAPLGEGFTVFLSAAFFALIHGNFYQLFYAFLIGAFLAFIYVKTGRLRYTIIYHMLVNFFGGFVAPLVYDLVDMEALSSVNIAAIAANIFPILLLLAYNVLVLGACCVGIIMMISMRHKFTLHKGLLQPPERWGGALFLNSGIAAAIAVLAFDLVRSLG